MKLKYFELFYTGVRVRVITGANMKIATGMCRAVWKTMNDVSEVLAFNRPDNGDSRHLSNLYKLLWYCTAQHPIK
jgi:hypothetical protein